MVQVSVSGEPVWLSEAWAPGMEKKEKLSLTQTTVQFSSWLQRAVGLAGSVRSDKQSELRQSGRIDM